MKVSSKRGQDEKKWIRTTFVPLSRPPPSGLHQMLPYWHPLLLSLAIRGILIKWTVLTHVGQDIFTFSSLLDHRVFSAFEIVFLHLIDLHRFFVHPHYNFLDLLELWDGEPIYSSRSESRGAYVFDVLQNGLDPMAVCEKERSMNRIECLL